MTVISHHIPTPFIRAYAAGSLSHGYSMVVAAHVSQCDECRARLEAEEIAGGAVLDAISPEMPQDGTDPLREQVLSSLDAPPPQDIARPRSGIFPGPVMQALGGRAPKWRPLGGGIRQSILHADASGTARLLQIPPGEAVPDHGHKGVEMTLVLQGSFSDETGHFGVGDVEIADEELDHTPVAGTGLPCICLAATDAPLRFHSFLPRLLQPIFRI
ncbi:MAG: cupin domain-containing protein [Rhodobacteraceae bacterium]|nr:cupin domain-containing protein [Paracoccaceae bacterium]